MTPVVSILTYCAHPALAYGTLMVFKTLRVGFPTAKIEVFDNGSHPEVREQIMRACAEVDAVFIAIEPQHWSRHIRQQLLEREDTGAPLVLVDPDVAFWSSVEGWDFGDALMSGRLMAEVKSGPIVSHARLHPSMLWVPSLARLRGVLHPDEVAPRMAPADGSLRFWDTLAAAHERLGPQCAAFTPEHLDSFDHLFFGSHLPAIDGFMADHDSVFHRCHHAVAAGDLAAIRGSWREQDAYFAGHRSGRTADEMAGDVVAAAVDAPARMHACVRSLRGPIEQNFTDDELREALSRLTARLRAPA